MQPWNVVTELEDPAWDRFVSEHPRGHFLQSAAWGRLRQRAGWDLRRIVLTATGGSGESPLAGAQLLVQERRGGRLAYAPRGPVCAPDAPHWPALAEALRDATRDCVALRLEPHWPDDALAREALAGAGLREAEALQPPSTLCLDLTRGSETLLADMKQKWRYNIRLAERKGVTVRREGAAALDLLEELISTTAARNGFAPRAAGYYAAVYAAFAAAGPETARLYVARYRDRPLAAILVLHHGHTATYLYGGSNGEERGRMPNHALQWRAIVEAEAAGLRHYDLWGIPDAIGRAAVAGLEPEAVEPEAGGLWGVWGFKRGFGGEVWRAVGAYDAVHAPLRYALGSRLLPGLRRLAGRGG